jgi:hypothetical protein
MTVTATCEATRWLSKDMMAVTGQNQVFLHLMLRLVSNWKCAMLIRDE